MILYGLTGYPLHHSRSPEWFNRKFPTLPGAEREYRLFPVRHAMEIITLIKATPELRGLNVTIPHKQAVIPLLDALDPLAGSVGAVNTITILRNDNTFRLKGFNTDYHGFYETIPVEMSNRSALILGAGGSSKAVGLALATAGIPFITVSRSKQGEGFITWKDLTPELIRNTHFIINTTPLGMFPRVGSAPPIPYDALTREHYLYDLVYNPEETLFIKNGKQYGASCINGSQMLIKQAERSLRIFLDEE